MKCPLRSISTKYPDEQIGHDDLNCLKEECAWWDEPCEWCAILTLSRALTALGSVVDEIKEKLRLNKDGQ